MDCGATNHICDETKMQRMQPFFTTFFEKLLNNCSLIGNK
jgi:hypothetical protein